MKKAIPLVIALILCLSLCACSSKNDSEAVIGNWTGKYEYQGALWTISDTNGSKTFSPGDTITMTISVYKGGTLQILRHDDNSDAEITSNGNNITLGHEIHSDTGLTIQGSNDAFPKT